MLNIIEIEYQELQSIGWANFKVGLKCTTTPETKDDDFANLVIEAKTLLQKVIDNAPKKQVSYKKKFEVEKL